MLVFDTSAWVEYFIGSRKGSHIRSIVESGNEEIATPLMVLIEFSCKAHAEQIAVDSQLAFIRRNSIILAVTEDHASSIGALYREMRKRSKKSSIIDALTALLAQERTGRVVTCDSDFAHLPDVIFIR